MYILFDVVNPLRQFKQGTDFNEDDANPFPVYDPQNHTDLMESDEEGILQPYKPSGYKYVRDVAPFQIFLYFSLSYFTL
jgi:hypothetical protein